MTQAMEKILSGALSLDHHERAELAGKLFESLESEGEVLSEAEHAALWEAEIKRRMEAVDRGEAKLIPWEEVKRSLGKAANEAR